MYTLLNCTSLIILYLLVVKILTYGHNERGNHCRYKLKPLGPLYTTYYVDLHGRGLRNLPSSSHFSKFIKILNASENNIASITDELIHLSELKVLNLGNNSLGNLEFIPLPCNLYQLNISYNMISSLERIKSCQDLEMLDISGNIFQDIPSDAFDEQTNLLHLYIENLNLLTLHIDTFRKLTKLRVLSLHGNKLLLPADIFLNSKCIQSLWLSKNQISELPFGLLTGFKHLEELHLDDNELHRISPGMFADSRKLKYLNVARNLLTALRKGSLTGLSKLERIILDNNNITELSPKTFQGLSSLEHLSVATNKLKQVMDLDTNIFPSLTYADFRRNYINYVTEESLRSWLKRGNRSSRILNLEENPLLASRAYLRVMEEPGVRATQKYGYCQCGALNRNDFCIQFCIFMPCGSRNDNWTEALTNATRKSYAT